MDVDQVDVVTTLSLGITTQLNIAPEATQVMEMVVVLEDVDINNMVLVALGLPTKVTAGHVLIPTVGLSSNLVDHMGHSCKK